MALSIAMLSVRNSLKFLRSLIPFLQMCGLNILASSYFTAIGNAKISIIISALRGLVFVGIGILVLPAVFGIDAIWYDVPIAEICTLSVSFWLVRRSLFNNRSN